MARSTAEVERPDDLIPLREAARRLGLSAKTLYNRCSEGRVEHYIFRHQKRGRLSIPVAEVERLKAEAIRPRVIDTTKPKKAKRR